MVGNNERTPVTAVTEVQNTAPSLTQHQCTTQQTITSNVTQKTSKTKRQRMNYSRSQMQNLENLFAKNNYLDRIKRLYVAQQLNLTERQVKTWYQNKRMKEKKIRKKMGLLSTGTESVTAADPVAAQDDPPTPAGRCDRQQQEQQQQQQQRRRRRRQQQYEERQQQYEERQERERARLVEHSRPNPSVTVHHYPSWHPNAPRVRYDDATVHVVPQYFPTHPSLCSQQRQRRQHWPCCPTIPTHGETTYGHGQPVQHGRPNGPREHRQHRRGHGCHACCAQVVPVPVPSMCRHHRRGDAADTEQQPWSTWCPQVRSAGDELTSNCSSVTTRATFDRALEPEYPVDRGPLTI